MKNEPAFPFTAKNLRDGYDEVYSGMTLRDYFAAKAMQGILAANFNAGDVDAATDNTAVAQHAYDIADAMLLARE